MNERDTSAGAAGGKILVPLNLGECPVETLTLVNGMAARLGATVILLHVINLNILAPEARIYQELEQEAVTHLRAVADRFLPASRSTVIRIRYGPVAKEIASEAREQSAKLVILRRPKPGFWRQVASRFFETWTRFMALADRARILPTSF